MAEMLLDDFKRTHLSSQPGVLDFTYKISSAGLAITFTSYLSIETARDGLSLEHQYMQNSLLVHNVLNSDLESSGLFSCICACACW